MAYVGTTQGLTEDQVTPVTGDVATGAGEEVHRINYTARNGSAANVIIGSSPVTVATQYGTLTVNPDGTYSYQEDSTLVPVNGLDTGEALDDVVTFFQNADGTGPNFATVTYHINGVNDAPVAGQDGPYNGATEDGGAYVVNAASGVLANDTDPDNADGSPSDTLTAVLLDDVDHGVLTLNPDGSFSYTPAANFHGADTFTYAAFDGTANSNPITVTINVAPDAAGTDDYQAVDDPALYTTNEGQGFTGNISDLTANDLNPDAEAITVSSISPLFASSGPLTGQQIGTVNYTVGNPTFSFTFNPTGVNYNGPAYFDYQASGSDEPANVSTGRVGVTINSVNDAPESADVTRTTTEDTPYTFQTADFAFTDANDTPPNGFNGVVITTLPTDGVIRLSGVPVTAGQFISAANIAANQLTFTPDGNENDNTAAAPGYTSFTFQVQDNGGTANGGVNTDPTPNTFSFNVTPVNDVPTAPTHNYTGTEDQTLTVNAANGLLTGANDGDPEVVQPMRVDSYNQPVGPNAGTVSVNPDGSFTYTPGPDFNGSTSFTYVIRDAGDDGVFGNGDDALSAPITANITVGNVSDDPVAGNDAFNMREDPAQPPFGAISNANGWFSEADLLANDSDPDTPTSNLRLSGVGGATNGTVELVTIGATRYAHFIPNADYSGPAQFVYAVTDPEGNSDVGTVNLTVQERSDGAPVATDDTITATERTVFTVTAAQLLANDTDPDNANAGAGTDALYIRDILNMQNVRYSNGADGIQGTLDDGNIQRDANGNIISFELVSTTDQNGITGRFDYVVDDSAARANVEGDTGTVGGLPAGPGEPRVPGQPDTRSGTDIGTVTINVTGTPDAPTPQNDDLGTVLEDSNGVTFTLAQLLSNDTDPDNPAGQPAARAGLTASPNFTNVTGGTITDNGNGTYTFKPTANYNGDASFTYTVTDPDGLTGSATAVMHVTPVNDPPVNNSETLTHTDTVGAPVIAEDRTSVFNVSQFLANDTDVDIARGEAGQAPLFIVPGSVSSAQGNAVYNTHGTATLADDTIDFTPTAGFSGPASIQYTVSDQAGGVSNVGTASFTVVDTVVGGGTGETLNAANNGQSTVIFGNGGNDTLNGTPQTDELYGGAGNDVLNGFGSDDFLRGGADNDTANGGDGNDSIYIDDGGTDVANGDAGNDGIFAGAAFDTTDQANGGAGNDTLALRGNYGSGAPGGAFLFSANNLNSIETLLLASGTNTTMFPAPGGTTAGPFSYFLVEQDQNVGAGQTLTIIAGSPAPGVNGLQAGENVNFDGSDEKDGMFRIFAGQGTDRLIGGQQSDGFFFETGAFTSADIVDGRAGTDSLALRGNYSANTVLTNVTNVETIALLSGNNNVFGGALYGSPGGPANGSFDYTITLAQGNVSAGQTLTINGRGFAAGQQLASNETMNINGNAVTGGNLLILAGDANDTLSGGRQSTPLGVGQGGLDVIYGGLGGDMMDGGGQGTTFLGDARNWDGSNIYLYRSAAESAVGNTGSGQTSLDHIIGFDWTMDKIDINVGGASNLGQIGGIAHTGAGPATVTDVNAVFNGSFTDTNSNAVLDNSEFNTQLAAQIDTALNPGQAAFLQVTSGFYAGSTIFVADINNDGSYTAGTDLVIVFDNLVTQLPPSTDFIM